MEKNLYRVINSILLASTVLFCFGKYIGVSRTTWYHCGILTAVIVGLAAFCYVKVRGKLLMGLSVATLTGVTLFVVGLEKVKLFVQSYLMRITGQEDIPVEGTMQNIASGYRAGLENGIASGDLIMEWGILHETVQVLLIAVGVFGLQLMIEKVFGLKIAVAVSLLGILFIDLFTARELPHIAVICVLTYVVIVFVEWTRRHWKKQKRKEENQYLVWIMPFVCLYFLLMLMMPAPDEPYDWQFVKDAYGRMRERYITITQNLQGKGKEDFELVASGFSEDGRLLGGIADVGQEVMTIQGQKNLKTNVYLVGKVYDTFTGRQWLQTNESTEEDRVLDALETHYAISMYDEDWNNYISSTKLHITYKYFNTGYLFAPLKTWKLWSPEAYENRGGTLRFAETVSYGTAYDVHFYQMNVDHIRFYELLDAERPEEDEVLWKSLQKDYIKDPESRYSLEKLAQRREEIKRVYGESAASEETAGAEETAVSRETYAWLAAATEGAVTDVEKLKAIESALAELTYTKTPGALPEEITTAGTFLDYFLRDSQQGFCSYFASAFVLLARAEGIPARYVEGFCVPVEGEQETIVYSDMAHAWPEAYIEGVGWIPFEPTPGYERIRYTPWEMVDHETKKPEGSIVTWEDWEETEAAGDVSGGAAEAERLAEEAEKLAEEAERVRRKNNIIKIVLFTLLLLIFAGLSVYGLDGYWNRRRRRMWSPEQAVMAELKTNLQLLAALGYQRAENETLTELEARAWAVMQYETDVTDNTAIAQGDEGENVGQKKELQFLRFYEEIYYGEHAATEEMQQRVLAEQNVLMEMLKKWKRLKYFYYKILLHKVIERKYRPVQIDSEG